MVDTGTALIVGSLISLIGMLIWSERSHIFWFKKENFKIQKSNLLAENKLKIKKLERELGLQSVSKKEDSPQSQNSLLGSLAPILKNMDPEQLKDVVDQFIGGSDETEQPDGIMGRIQEIAEDNPEIVSNILSSVMKGFKDGTPTKQEQISQV